MALSRLTNEKGRDKIEKKHWDVMEMKSIEEVREFFKQDRFATENGAVIEEIGEGTAVCSLTLTEHHRNAVGGVMGGVPFMLADFAFAVASNWQQVGSVSLSTNITFVGTAKGERLIARAECVKNGRSTNYYQVHVTDEKNNPVAAVTVTGFIKK